MTDPIDPAEVVHELSRRYAAGDMAGAMALFHPGLRIEQPASLPHGGWHEGTDGMAAMGATFAEHWDRAIVDPRILGCGATVVQITTQTWTAKATGRSETVDVVELMSIVDGLVAEIRVFQQDTARLLATLDRGLGPRPPRICRYRWRTIPAPSRASISSPSKPSSVSTPTLCSPMPGELEVGGPAPAPGPHRSRRPICSKCPHSGVW